MHITDSSESLPSHIQKIIDEVNCHSTYIIFTSKLALSPKSTLRAYFEQSKVNMAIACYHDEGKNLHYIIDNYLKKKFY